MLAWKNQNASFMFGTEAKIAWDGTKHNVRLQNETPIISERIQ